MRPLVLALSLAIAAGASGCISARIDAERGDIAAKGVEHDHAPIALTVAVSPFEDRTEGGRLRPGTLDAFTRSYAAVLKGSKVFLDVFPVRPRSVAGVPPPADLRVRGRVHEAILYTNYAWLTGWGVIAVGTLGYGAFIGPIIGLPYATDHAVFEIEVRYETADGKPLKTLRTRVEKHLWLSVYSDSDATQTGLSQDPRRPLQMLMGEAVDQVLADRAPFLSIAEKKR